MDVCTCIIPFYNEGERILKVLDGVVKIKGINEIICVDDGSIDNTLNKIKKRFPNIRLVRHDINLGKTEAISTGLRQTKDKYILLLDGDLRNFNYRHIEKAVLVIQKDKTIDMIILRRINAPFIIKLNRGDILLAGERILKKNDLEKVITKLKPKGYQIEFAINQYMMENHKNVYWMPSSALNTYPTHKQGFLKGIYKIIEMQIDILRFISLYNFFKQEFFFCRKKLE